MVFLANVVTGVWSHRNLLLISSDSTCHRIVTLNNIAQLWQADGHLTFVCVWLYALLVVRARSAASFGELLNLMEVLLFHAD